MLVSCVKCEIFYGEILHVIPKVLSCFFGTKKIDFLDFGGRVGDKMAERVAGRFMCCARFYAALFLWLRRFKFLWLRRF